MTIEVPSDWSPFDLVASDFERLGHGLSNTIAGAQGLVDQAIDLSDSLAVAMRAPAGGFRTNLQVFRLPRDPDLTVETLARQVDEAAVAMALDDVVVGTLTVDSWPALRLNSSSVYETDIAVRQSTVWVLTADDVWALTFATADPADSGTFESTLLSVQILSPSS